MKFPKIPNTVVAKIAVITCFWVIALVPTWIYLLIRVMADPTGFWQELAIIFICMIIMGWAQVLLAVVATFITVAVIVDDTI